MQAAGRLPALLDASDFAAKLGDYLDIENFARYMALTAWLTDLDGILGPGQNFYLYLHPKTPSPTNLRESPKGRQSTQASDDNPKLNERMSDRLRISNTWGKRFADQKIAVPALLRRAGLPVGLFEQEKVYLTTAQLFALWRSVGEMNSDPAIGLKLGGETRLARSHPAGIAVLCSRTFEDALQRLARYKQLTCPEEIRVERKSQEASVELCYVEAEEPQPDLLADMVLSWILSVGRHGTESQITPLRVDLTRPAKHRALFERHFGCRVRFKADRNALIFRSSDLDIPFVTHNEEMLEVVGTHLESELKAKNASANIGEQVKQTLSRSMAGKRPTLEDVAKQLGLGARTLQRRLTDASLTFQQLVEDTRRELAHHFLKQRAVELNETAFLLGFEDANSFFRAFQIWEGISPGEWRDRQSLSNDAATLEASPISSRGIKPIFTGTKGRR